MSFIVFDLFESSVGKMDLNAGAFELTSEPRLQPTSFFTRQAAEKALKAFLTWISSPFRKTHNLEDLDRAVPAFRSDSAFYFATEMALGDSHI